jgi:ribosomal protein L11 methyltransferase
MGQLPGEAGAWPALTVTGFSQADATADPTGAAVTDLFQAALTDYDVPAIDETSDDAWRVFFLTEEMRDRAAAALRPAFPTLSIEPLDVPDEDWAAKSQANLHAVQIGRVIVAPPWDVPTTIVIQPSMGFGTGHHATTRLCLAALQRLDLAGRSVLDVGTGSGVLAITASRLGAADVTGIDDDADAVHAAWENLALNAGAQVSLLVGDFRTDDVVPADVVLANLTGGLLIASAERLRRLVNARGSLILSGFMTSEERDVVAAFAAFTVEHRADEDGWVCVTVR